jgi:hypothetical protein
VANFYLPVGGGGATVRFAPVVPWAKAGSGFDLERKAHGIIEVLSWQLTGVELRKFSDRSAVIQIEIRTGHLPNINSKFAVTPHCSVHTVWLIACSLQHMLFIHAYALFCSYICF